MIYILFRKSIAAAQLIPLFHRVLERVIGEKTFRLILVLIKICAIVQTENLTSTAHYRCFFNKSSFRMFKLIAVQSIQK
jgi:hypothetical protein